MKRFQWKREKKWLSCKDKLASSLQAKDNVEKIFVQTSKTTSWVNNALSLSWCCNYLMFVCCWKQRKQWRGKKQALHLNENVATWKQRQGMQPPWHFFFVPLLVQSKFIRKLKNVKIFQKKRINKTAKYLFRLFVAMWSSV